MYRRNWIASVDVENVKLLNAKDSYQAAIERWRHLRSTCESDQTCIGAENRDPSAEGFSLVDPDINLWLQQFYQSRGGLPLRNILRAGRILQSLGLKIRKRSFILDLACGMAFGRQRLMDVIISYFHIQPKGGEKQRGTWNGPAPHSYPFARDDHNGLFPSQKKINV
ncbi:uncharacterized protein BKA55DRAFT_538165 [Fusarium redolens]|uniref:Uncharacterized protein n=1 Tax=Fusarium redolens TaxID=48865 RepID=A0A9P9HDU6_FUSRE|nr:uncharacterized protein BKA55DRAFT_538165 [Fusarium redolens]KAH7255790.1 hypothetical protein BKA55DRAFT_538165 [Fusarium redolens]